jgi:ABC-type Zn uptake system ZnuABC Zn-binding protein ZnuA
MSRIRYWRLQLPLAIAFLAIAPVVFSAGAVRAEKLNIVATTPDIASIARIVAGAHADVRSIGSGQEDPHFLQAKPSYILMARDADLWIRVGMELEVGWEPPILEGARNPGILAGKPGNLDVSENVLKLEIPTTRLTRAMGDVHPGGNPHYWLDPLNGRLIAGSIADRLSLLSPGRASDFRRNSEQFQLELDRRMFGNALVDKVGGARLWDLEARGELDRYIKAEKLQGMLGGWLGRLRPFQGEEIVTYHKSWIYFTNRFGLNVMAELEPKPGIPPSPSHLASVVDSMKGKGCRIILMEPFYSRKAADFVASKTGAEVIVCANSVGGQPEAADYLALIDLVVGKLEKPLQKLR